MNYTIKQGNNIDILKQYEDNHFDSIVTDPPYGIEFLGKDWDSNTGAVETWKQCYRVLKPGGHLLAFSAARTYHHLATNIEATGFEIRDQLMWIYASGFPKAQTVKNHPGWKTALKPAHEPIVMARKPFKGSTYVNMDSYGVGAVNIDATRLPTTDTRSGGANGHSRLTFGEGETSNEDSFKSYTPDDKGRYPSNVLGEITDYQKYFFHPKVQRAERHIGFDNLPKRICPQVDEKGHIDMYQIYDKQNGESTEMTGQKNVGNNHPTVKPVALMRYLVELVTPKGGKILDPFCGSGSTGMAAVEADMCFTGCELDPDYVAIANKRIEAWQQKTQPDNNFNQLFD